MAGAADRSEVLAAIERSRAWLSARVARFGLPGVSIAVVHDQDLVWVEAFGEARPAALYRIGSITKALTATALLRLRDAGKLSLDDPLDRYLPWFRPAGAGRPITLRHVLTHTSGLPREAPFPYWSDFGFPTAEALRTAVAEVSPVHRPDWRWKYSNLAFALAGLAIEAVTGRSYTHHLKEAVLAPLGMAAAVAPEADLDGLAVGHGRQIGGAPRRPRPHSDLRALASAGGLAATAADLARFVMLQFRDPPPGADVLCGDSLREMRRMHRLDDDWQAGWGLGFRLWRAGGRTWAGHAGLIAGFAGDLRFQPEARLGIVVLVNAEDGLPGEIAHRLGQWLLPPLAAVPPAVAAPDADLARYVGRYRDEWMDLEVLCDQTGLYAMTPQWLDPTSSIVRLEPDGPHAFRMRTADGFGYADERMTFDLDGAGTVLALRIGGNPLGRIERW
ncbi:MAG: serine hydrolase [Alphaproteobacteria bacterium]